MCLYVYDISNMINHLLIVFILIPEAKAFSNTFNMTFNPHPPTPCLIVLKGNSTSRQRTCNKIDDYLEIKRNLLKKGVQLKRGGGGVEGGGKIPSLN